MNSLRFKAARIYGSIRHHRVIWYIFVIIILFFISSKFNSELRPPTENKLSECALIFFIKSE
jgi:hypothetical protein